MRVVAVYFFGRSRLTPTAKPTASTQVAAINRQRPRRCSRKSYASNERDIGNRGVWDSVSGMPAIAATVLVLIPLVIAPGWLFYYDVTPKIALLLAGTAVLLPCFRPRLLL